MTGFMFRCLVWIPWMDLGVWAGAKIHCIWELAMLHVKVKNNQNYNIQAKHQMASSFSMWHIQFKEL